ncbi:MAG: hypothetical protein HY465_03130 [Deltaproteobacteria bacterium]|nr:hypothetical protein [Deltaproteobacteria bacterium]
MWRLIKTFVYTAIVIGVVLTFTGYKIDGKTVPQYLQGLFSAKGMGEGVKDIRVLVGEAIKAVGAEIAPQELTEEEQKKLDELVKREIEKGKPVEGKPDQKALPPEKKK